MGRLGYMIPAERNRRYMSCKPVEPRAGDVAKSLVAKCSVLHVNALRVKVVLSGASRQVLCSAALPSTHAFLAQVMTEGRGGVCAEVCDHSVIPLILQCNTERLLDNYRLI